MSDHNQVKAFYPGVFERQSVFFISGEVPAEINDAHACGKEDVAIRATRTRRGGTRSVP